MNKSDLKYMYGIMRRYRKTVQETADEHSELVERLMKREIVFCEMIIHSHSVEGIYYSLAVMLDNATVSNDRYVDAKWLVRQWMKNHKLGTDWDWDQYLEKRSKFLRHQASRKLLAGSSDIPF